jgi:hypothetical protein
MGRNAVAAGHPAFNLLRLIQIGLDTAVSQMDIRRVQQAGSEIDKLVRHAGGPDQDLSGLGLDGGVANREGDTYWDREAVSERRNAFHITT